MEEEKMLNKKKEEPQTSESLVARCSYAPKPWNHSQFAIFDKKCLTLNLYKISTPSSFHISANGLVCQRLRSLLNSGFLKIHRNDTQLMQLNLEDVAAANHLLHLFFVLMRRILNLLLWLTVWLLLLQKMFSFPAVILDLLRRRNDPRAA